MKGQRNCSRKIPWQGGYQHVQRSCWKRLHSHGVLSSVVSECVCMCVCVCVCVCVVHCSMRRMGQFGAREVGKAQIPRHLGRHE